MSDTQANYETWQAPFSTCPTRAISDARLNGTDLRVLLVIGLYDRRSLAKCEGDGCFAGQRTLAEQIGIDRKNLRQSIKKLVQIGYLKRSKSPGKRGDLLQIIESEGGTETPGKGGLSTPYSQPHDQIPSDLAGVTSPPTTGVPVPPDRGSPNPPKRIIKETIREDDLFIDCQSEQNASGPVRREKDEVDRVLVHWNDVAVPAGARPIRKLTGKRRKLIRSRINSEGLKDVLAAIDRVPTMSWALGKSDDSSFKANIDWLLRDGKINAILEGQHDDYRSKRSEPETYLDYVLRERRAEREREAWSTDHIIC